MLRRYDRVLVARLDVADRPSIDAAVEALPRLEVRCASTVEPS